MAYRSAAVGGPCSVPGGRSLAVPEIHQHPPGCILDASGFGNTVKDPEQPPLKKGLIVTGWGGSQGLPVGTW